MTSRRYPRQLLFQLFFRPSAWRQYVARIDPELSPSFALFQLSQSQWRQPALRRLLLFGYGVWPLLAGCTVGLWLGLSGEAVYVIRGMVYTILLNIISGILGGITISVAFSLVAGFSGSLLAGLLFGLDETWYEFAVLSGLFALGLGSSVLSALQTKEPSFSIGRQAAAVFAGVAGTLIVLVACAAAVRYVLVLFLPESINAQEIWLIGMVLGIGLAFGAYTRCWGWAWGLMPVFGLLTAAMTGSMGILAPWLKPVTGSVMNGLLFPILFALPYLLARDIGGQGAGAIAGLLGCGGVYVSTVTLEMQTVYLPLLSVPVFVLGWTQNRWRPILMYPFEMAYGLWLYRRQSLLKKADESKGVKKAKKFLLRNPAFWDEHQRLPLYGLEKHLVLLVENYPHAGRAALDFLSHTHQRWAVQAALLELFIRDLLRCATIEDIQKARLPGIDQASASSEYPRRFARISKEVEAALAREDRHIRLQSLEQAAGALSRLFRELTLSNDADALRLCAAVENWREILSAHTHRLKETLAQSRAIKNPYVSGVPLTTRLEVFVGRKDVSARIEALLQDCGSPAILLYGQRRMGKTSLLYHLGRLLPAHYVPLFIGLQGAAAAETYSGFFSAIARAMRSSARENRQLELPPLTREMLQADPFISFDEWLDSVEEKEGIFLLGFDEFEALHNVFVKGRLDKDLILGAFRQIIQHRPRFRVLIAGAHLLEQFPDWAGYLINMETVRLSYLKQEEARLLIERPVKDFALRYVPEAVDDIVRITRCHPDLLQSLCKEIVRLKNSQEVNAKHRVQCTDVEAAVENTLESRKMLFMELAKRPREELDLLAFIAAQKEDEIVSRTRLAENFPEASLDKLLSRLIQVELLEAPQPDAYSFQVELIRRWFRN
ncbi:MAG: ATP-binding protein [Gammaproteobacteria bacterium]|nr:ATP-binding protein [Gammaproteobacteria bacterium]